MIIHDNATKCSYPVICSAMLFVLLLCVSYLDYSNDVLVIMFNISLCSIYQITTTIETTETTITTGNTGIGTTVSGLRTITPVFALQSSTVFAHYASCSMDGDLETFSSTDSKDSEWIGYIFDQFYKISFVDNFFKKGSRDGMWPSGFVELVLRTEDIKKKSLSEKADSDFTNFIDVTINETITEEVCLPWDERNGRMSFSCAEVDKASSLFVRMKSNYPLKIAEIIVYGEPYLHFADNQLKDYHSENNPLAYQYHLMSYVFKLNGNLENNVLILKENSQYLAGSPKYNLFVITPEFLPGDSSITIQPGVGIQIGGCPIFHSFEVDLPICDGTKTEEQYNTWYIHFHSEGLVLYCDSTLFKMIDDWETTCLLPRSSMATNEYDYRGFKAGALLELVRVTDEPGLMDVNFFPLGSFVFNNQNSQNVPKHARCIQLSVGISSKCKSLGAIVDESGVVKPEAQFVRDAIIREFNSSINLYVAKQRIRRNKINQLKSEIVSTHLDKYVDKSYQNFKSSEEGQAFIEQNKKDIIAETEHVEKSKRYHIALKAFKSARNFYGCFMNNFLSEIAGSIEIDHARLNTILEMLSEAAFLPTALPVESFAEDLGLTHKQFDDFVDTGSDQNESIEWDSVANDSLIFTRWTEMEHFINFRSLEHPPVDTADKFDMLADIVAPSEKGSI